MTQETRGGMEVAGVTLQQPILKRTNQLQGTSIKLFPGLVVAQFLTLSDTLTLSPWGPSS
jgi:hypothetical protein